MVSKPKTNGNGKGKRQRRRRGPRPLAPTRALPRTSAAVAYSTPVLSGQPRITRTATNECRIVHRELIHSVVTSQAFSAQRVLALNPGIAATFPWLSKQAVGWERYKFNKVSFRYVARLGTGTAGNIMLSPDYDAADPPPANEFAASNNQNTIQDVPWKDIVCNLSVRDMLAGEKDKYVRLGALGPNLDIKMYDSGNMHVITSDFLVTNGTTAGKLWVEYDVTFRVPQLQEDAAANAQTLGLFSGVSRFASFFGAVRDVVGGLPVEFLDNKATIMAVGQFLHSYYVRAKYVDPLLPPPATTTEDEDNAPLSITFVTGGPPGMTGQVLRSDHHNYLVDAITGEYFTTFTFQILITCTYPGQWWTMDFATGFPWLTELDRLNLLITNTQTGAAQRYTNIIP